VERAIWQHKVAFTDALTFSPICTTFITPTSDFYSFQGKETIAQLRQYYKIKQVHRKETGKEAFLLKTANQWQQREKKAKEI
jgi:hypothetical protein